MKKAQATVEFAVVFLMLIALFFALIEIGLYWRGRYATETLANEMLSNAQLAPLPSDSSYCPAADVAIDLLTKKIGLFNLDKSKFSLLRQGQVYIYTSDTQINAEPKLVLTVDCTDIRKNNLRLDLRYKHHGAFLYTKGININSAQNSSSQKY